MVMNPEHKSKFAARPSPVMVKSQYGWKILELDVQLLNEPGEN